MKKTVKKFLLLLLTAFAVNLIATIIFPHIDFWYSCIISIAIVATIIYITRDVSEHRD